MVSAFLNYKWRSIENGLTSIYFVLSLPVGKEVMVAMITSTLTSKGQITVPKKIREFLGVGESDKLSFTPLEDGKVLLSVKHPSAAILFGMLGNRKQPKPVSIEEMEAAIAKRRLQRGAK